MKKPTKKEWMEHHTEMHILAKQAARLNDYVFDPETKKEQMKYATKLITNTKLNDYVFDPKTSPQIQFENPKSLKKITMLDEIKPTLAPITQVDPAWQKAMDDLTDEKQALRDMLDNIVRAWETRDGTVDCTEEWWDTMVDAATRGRFALDKKDE